MEHQDWHTITFNKVLKEQNKKEIDEKKLKLSTNLDYKLSKKEEEKGLKHDNVSQNISKIIRDARCSKNLTQKQLANMVNLPVKIITDIENGNAKYNPQNINKIKRVLKLQIKNN